MLNNIAGEIKKIVDKHTIEARDVTRARRGADGDNVIYREIEQDRIETNFIRIILASVVLFFVEASGMLWAFFYDDIEFGSARLFVISFCLFTAASVVFVLLVEKELSRKNYSKRNKRILYSIYWIAYMIETMSFSIMEAYDRGKINNYVTFIIVFSLLPILKPLQKCLIYAVACFAEVGILTHLGVSYRVRVVAVAVTCAGVLFSIVRFYFYIANSLVTKRLEYSANGDSLTGFMNRRGLLKRIEGLQGFCRGNRYYICALMIDIDDFKAFNDTYGHLKGDSCLRAVSGEIRSSFMRPTDLCVRYGGEEFLIITAQRDVGRFLDHTKLMHKHIGEKKLEQVDREVTVSIGVCVRTYDNCEDLGSIVDCADKELYLAKNNGKNCIYYKGERL